MPAILPDYAYDIFISYRQNDNKRDGWVTNFVAALKDELEATLKNPVSIYFDENPHDGLLETHQVDASLAKKLKCLVFIPIISQTYCDETSFAWEHEFLPFLKMAKDDDLGMNITLSNGNVVSRVLPIRIHDLEMEDQNTLEAILDGPLRSIDFIYGEAGVNRPLSPDDKREDNLNATTYKNQINKVANALKDIGNSLIRVASGTSINTGRPTYSASTVSVVPKSKKKNLLAAIAIIVVIAIVGIYYGYPFTKNEPPDTGNMSIAVLPFEDMSPNGDQEYFSDGLAEEIINVLMQIPNIKVVGRTSSFSFKNSDTDAQTIGRTLNATHLVQGSVRKYGELVKVQINIIDVKTGFNIKSYSFPETQLANIFELQDKIARAVTSDLKLSLLSTQGNQIATSRTESPAALEEFFKGRKLWSERRDLIQAIAHFENAIALDPNYDRAYSALAETYVVLPSYTSKISTDIIVSKASAAIENSLRLNPVNVEALTAKGRFEYKFNLNWAGSEEAFKKAISLNPNYGPAHFWYGIYLHESEQLDKVKEKYMITVELEPRWAVSYFVFGLYYLNVNDDENASKLFSQSREIQPDYVNNDLADFYLAVKGNNFLIAQQHWQAYNKNSCDQFNCNEQDLISVMEILSFLATNKKKITPELRQKLENLSSVRDRVTFAALLGERKILYAELNNLMNEDSYNFCYVLRYFYLDKFRNETEFKAILKKAGL